MSSVQSKLSSKEKAENQKERNVWVLYVAGVFVTASQVLLLHSLPALVIKHYRNSNVRAVKTLHQSASMASAIEFALNPVLGSLSDSLGRKLFLFGAPLAAALSNYTVFKDPEISKIIISRILCKLLGTAFFTVVTASGSDMFKTDEHMLADVHGKIRAVKGLAVVLGPAIGGRLAEKNIMLPYLLSAALCSIASLLVLFGYRETLPPQERKPFKIKKGFNPLLFLTLFSKSPLLAKFSLITALQSAPEYLGTVQQVYAYDVAGWDAKDYGDFATLAGVTAFIAGTQAGRLVKKWGPKLFSVITNGLSTFAFLWWGFSVKLRWGAHIGLAVNSLGHIRRAAASARMTTIAGELGMGRGELAASKSNLNAVVKVFAPLLFSWLYGNGPRFGIKGLAQEGCAAMLALAQILILSLGDNVWRFQKKS